MFLKDFKDICRVILLLNVDFCTLFSCLCVCVCVCVCKVVVFYQYTSYVVTFFLGQQALMFAARD